MEEGIDVALIDKIIDNFKSKSTEELLTIYKTQYKDQWSREAIEAIKIILWDRNCSLPDLPRRGKKRQKPGDDSDSFLKFILPRYDELTLFLMSMTFVILLILNSGLQKDFTNFVFKDTDPRTIFALLFFVIGLVSSLYHIFTNKPKTYSIKFPMLTFAVFLNGFSGIAAGVYMVEHSSGLLLIFPTWNILNSIMLLILYRFHFIDEDCISDVDAKPRQITIGLLAILVLLFFCNFLFKFYWAITLSITVTYASMVNRVVEKLILQKKA